MNSLVGRFFHFVQEGYYCTGCILEVSGEFVLVDHDPFAGCPVRIKRVLPLSVVYEELQIFDTREELETWMNWVTGPESKPTVVSLNARADS